LAQRPLSPERPRNAGVDDVSTEYSWSAVTEATPGSFSMPSAWAAVSFAATPFSV
jgi:hypothetical protein